MIYRTDASSPKTVPRGNLSSLFTDPLRITTCNTKLAQENSVPSVQNQISLDEFLKINCKSGNINVGDAHNFFDHMLNMKPIPPISSFNTFFGAVAKTKHYVDVISLYKRMNSIGLLLDFIRLNILLNCFCNMNWAGLGFVVLAEILKRGYCPNIVIFTSFFLKGSVWRIGLVRQWGCLRLWSNWVVNLMGLCSMGYVGNTGVALKLHEEMVNGNGGFGSGFKLNLVCYNIVIDSLCKDGLLDKAKGLFKEMSERGICPDVVLYSSIIDGCFRAGKWEEAKGLFNEMVDQGIWPNTVTFNVLIDALCKEGKATEANVLLELMIQRGEKPDAITYNSLMDGFCLEGRIDNAWELFASMTRKGHECNVVGYNILMNGYYKSGRIEEAMKLYREMIYKGVSQQLLPITLY